MKKNYVIDVTLNGSLAIQAENEEEARQIYCEMTWEDVICNMNIVDEEFSISEKVEN